LLCLKKPDKIALPKAGSISAESRKSLLTVKRICPIHAEPVHDDPYLKSLALKSTRFSTICFWVWLIVIGVILIGLTLLQ